MKKIAKAPIIEYNPKTGKVIEKHQLLYLAFTTFIWEFVYNMPVGTLLREVHPIGQAQKRQALLEIIERFNSPKEKVMYVGDSQTDVQCIQELKRKGLTMMFNGKGRVCDDADIMYIGENAIAIEEVADLFAKVGRQKVIDYYTPPRQTKYGGLLAAVTPDNITKLKEMSVRKRKEFRGIHIGGLT
jgi:predicted HAD superfamily phosphohydrolase